MGANQEQHVEDVKLGQAQINQEISNDFAKKSKLLAERLPDLRTVEVCNSTTVAYRDLPTVPTSAGSVTETTSDALSTSSRDEAGLICGNLADDAVQTTLMLVEIQRWLQRQASVRP